MPLFFFQKRIFFQKLAGELKKRGRSRMCPNGQGMGNFAHLIQARMKSSFIHRYYW